MSEYAYPETLVDTQWLSIHLNDLTLRSRTRFQQFQLCLGYQFLTKFQWF